MGNGLKVNKWYVLYAVLACCQFLIAIHYVGVDSLWHDELYEIGWSVNATNITERIFSGVDIKPIFASFFYLWYKIAPYGEKWLLLPMEIATALGVFIIGAIAKQVKDGLAGFFAALIAMVSPVLLSQCSYEIRSYSFYMCFAAMLYYLYGKRLLHIGNETILDVVRISIVMVLYAGMHYHAVIRCMILFAFDAFLILKKKVKARVLVPYVIAALSYLPAIYMIIKRGTISTFDTFAGWIPTPTVNSALEFLEYFSGGFKFSLVFFFLAMACFFINYYEALKNKGTFLTEVKLLGEFVFYYLFIVTFAIFFIHGRFISPDKSLWVRRYFVDMLPIVIAMAGTGCSTACGLLQKGVANPGFVRKSLSIFVSIVLIYSVLPRLITAATTIRQPYRQLADWLYSQEEIIEQDALVVSWEPDVVVDGWKEYYLDKQGTRTGIRAVAASNVSPEELAKEKTIYVWDLHKSAPDKDLVRVLDECFVKERDVSEYKMTVYSHK